VGALVLTPLVFRVITGWKALPQIAPRTWLEAAAFGLAAWAVTQVVFSAPPASFAMPFVLFPVMLWGSVRLGVVAIGAALCLVVALTAHDTNAGLGPFAAERLSSADRLIALQTYVGAMALSFHALSVLWDERARTAAALRLAHSGLEARYRRIVEQSPYAVVAVTSDGIVQDANAAWRRLWSSGSRPGSDTGAAPPWKDPAIEPLLRRAFAGDIVELPERELTSAGGRQSSPRLIRGFAYPVTDDSGEVTEVVLIERDITDEVRAHQRLVDAYEALREREEALQLALRQMADAQAHREQLLEAERSARGDAERASMLKDEFLATLSHELRTPLNAIIGWVHILRRSSKDPGLDTAIDTIDRNARAQAKLIEDLLDVARITAGKVGLTFARLSLPELVADAADGLRPVAAAKGVTLTVAHAGIDDGRDGVWTSGDAPRLQQVVTNLIGNAIKFTPPGGRVDVHLTRGEGVAELTVTDTGEGIGPEFLPAVFERFRQADGSLSRRHGGLGLGLSIARQIVEMHGGSITAHSDGPGLGARFTVTLPLAHQAERIVVDGEVATAAPLTGLRVLVVDDEADARELLRRLLTEQGCLVTCASSAAEALGLLAGTDCDVMLTDIGMPVTDGYELLRRVRTSGCARLTAIAVTAFARREDRDRALSAGFDGHLPKPVNPAHLMQVLGRIAAAAAAPPS